jgi:hypothetical protein
LHTSSYFNLRFWEGEASPFFSLVINNLNLLHERGQTGKGANLALFGGAVMALCSRRTKRVRLSFPDSFSLVHFFWRSKRNEHYYEKRGCHFETPDITEDNRGLLITPSVIREPLVPVLQTENKHCASLSAFHWSSTPKTIKQL